MKHLILLFFLTVSLGSYSKSCFQNYIDLVTFKSLDVNFPYENIAAKVEEIFDTDSGLEFKLNSIGKIYLSELISQLPESAKKTVNERMSQIRISEILEVDKARDRFLDGSFGASLNDYIDYQKTEEYLKDSLVVYQEIKQVPMMMYVVLIEQILDHLMYNEQYVAWSAKGIAGFFNPIPIEAFKSNRYAEVIARHQWQMMSLIPKEHVKEILDQVNLVMKQSVQRIETKHQERYFQEQKKVGKIMRKIHQDLENATKMSMEEYIEYIKTEQIIAEQWMTYMFRSTFLGVVAWVSYSKIEQKYFSEDSQANK